MVWTYGAYGKERLQRIYESGVEDKKCSGRPSLCIERVINGT